MRSYNQYCSIARALDIVGDRWTLLIVRELLLRGPSRFTDIKVGLPGIATNLLSSRLKELEGAGLVTRKDAPPPVATVLYDLSEDGLALEPVLQSIGMWGLRFMDRDSAEDTFQDHWLAYAPLWFTVDSDPGGPPAAIQLVASGQKAVIELRDGRIHTRVGEADEPDLVIDGSPRAVLGLLTGILDVKTATKLGLAMHGRRALLRRLAPQPNTWARELVNA